MSGNIVTDLMAPHLVEWYVDIYTNVYGADTTYSDIILKFNMYLKRIINGATFGVFSNIVLTIGIVLLLFHFFSDLTEKAATKQLSVLQMGKSFCILFGTIFVMFHTKEIFIFMLKMVENINESLTVNKTGTGAVTMFLNDETHTVQLLLSKCVSEHFSLWAILGYTLTAFVLMLVSLATRIYITYYAATRIIQLFVYYIFAPIGVADIFENGPGGTINMQSSGFRYLKTIFAIMLQVVVISVVCQTFSLVSSSINFGYFADHGDESVPDSDADSALQAVQSVTYPLRQFEYTDHSAPVRDLIVAGKNKISESLKKLAGMMGDDDAGSDPDTGQTKEQLKDSEKYKVTDIIAFTGKPIKHAGDTPGNTIIDKIHKPGSPYRMTIESTELFFNWCTGSDGTKMALFIILMITKVLMVYSSSKLCNYIVGTSI